MDQHKIAGVFRESLEKPKIPESWFCFGNSLKELANFEEAASYQFALTLDPYHQGATINLGLLLHRLDKLPQALHFYADAVKSLPNSVELCINYGKMLADIGKPALAICEYKRGLQFSPESGELLFNLAGALVESNLFEDAIRYYARLASLVPDFPDLDFNIGNAFFHSSRYDVAVSYYQKATLSSRSPVKAFLQLGKSLVKIGRVSEAEEAFVSAIDYDPGCAQAYLSIAHINNDRGMIEDAILACKKALVCVPDYLEPTLLLADIYKTRKH